MVKQLLTDKKPYIVMARRGNHYQVQLGRNIKPSRLHIGGYVEVNFHHKQGYIEGVYEDGF